MTASHNPKEYNGYKVYDEFGCQLVPGQAKQVISYVDAITDYHTINFTGDDSKTFMADVTDNFVMAVLKQSRYADLAAKQNLKIVYTPPSTARATSRSRRCSGWMGLHRLMLLQTR